MRTHTHTHTKKCTYFRYQSLVSVFSYCFVQKKHIKARKQTTAWRANGTLNEERIAHVDRENGRERDKVRERKKH